MAEKPELGLLIGVGKPKGEPALGEESAAPEDGKLLAVAAFRKALKSGDDQAVLDALMNVFDQLDQDEAVEEPEAAPGPESEMPF